MQSDVTVSLLPKTKKELAIEYGISAYTISKWCSAIGINKRGMLTIPELKKFYAHYDYPQRNVNVNTLK